MGNSDKCCCKFSVSWSCIGLAAVCCWPRPSPLSSSPFISIHKDQHKDCTVRLECNFCHLLNIVLLMAYTLRGSWNMEMKLLFLCTCTVCRPVQLYDSCVWILIWRADFTDGGVWWGWQHRFWGLLSQWLLNIHWLQEVQEFKCKFPNENLWKYLCWNLH